MKAQGTAFLDCYISFFQQQLFAKTNMGQNILEEHGWNLEEYFKNWKNY